MNTSELTQNPLTLENYIVSITIEEFQKYKESLGQAKDEVTNNNRTLQKGPSFANQLKEKVINFCREYAQKDITCFLVESTNYLTVWFEKTAPLMTAPIYEAQSLNPQPSESELAGGSVQQNRKYRGLAYTQENLHQDPLSAQPASSQKRPVKRYRGSVYE